MNTDDPTRGTAAKHADISAARSHLLQAALKYAELGWPVLPLHSISPDGHCACRNPGCSSPGKHPLTNHGVKDATTDPEVIRAWWSEHPDANIGIATGCRSGFVALDIDPRHGGDESLAQLGAEHGDLPETVVSLTGGGGRHLLFKHPSDGKVIRNAATLAGLGGLDLRGDGGYIVVPPSRHASGQAYTWEQNRDPFGGSTAPMPDWLKKLLADRAGGGSGGQLSAAAEKIPEGRRNSVLTSLGGAMRRCGMGEAAILAALLQENATRCMPPLSEREVKRIAQSVARYQPPRDAAEDLDLNLPQWPDVPASEAYHGLAGDIVRAIEPHSEADPVALLLQFLVLFGNVIGRGPHFKAEADVHCLNLYVGLVGMTSKGRKGVAWGQIKRLFEAVEDEWVRGRIISGLLSGEGLIASVRDRVEKMEPVRDQSKRVTDYEPVIVDHGVDDKRVVFLEKELASTLRVLEREGSNLSAMLRQAWETGDLRVVTKNSPTQATGAHVSLVGHITKDELRRYLNRTEIANGFANRFLLACVRRSKFLPEGGRIHEVDFAPLLRRLEEVILFARTVGEMRRDAEARELWAAVYEKLSEGKPGIFGAATSRAEAQVMRLACLYTLLDRSTEIRRVHLQAALALWRYCEDSCRFIFGDSLGDPVADELRTVLRSRPAGMTRTEIRDHFKRHQSAAEIGRALGVLAALGIARREVDMTNGRPRERWIPVLPATEATDPPEGVIH